MIRRTGATACPVLYATCCRFENDAWFLILAFTSGLKLSPGANMSTNPTSGGISVATCARSIIDAGTDWSRCLVWLLPQMSIGHFCRLFAM